MSIKSIPNSIKLFIVIILIWVALWSTYLLPFSKDFLGRPCGREIGDYMSILLLFGMPIVILLAIMELFKKNIPHDKKNFILLILVISSFILLFDILVTFGERHSSFEARIMGTMAQLSVAQEKFYNQEGRYANTQEELIEAGIIDKKLAHPYTGEEFTDRDGHGIEGGDDNPETWEAVTFIPTKEFNSWCQRIKEGYLFVCNQREGCRREN